MTRAYEGEVTTEQIEMLMLFDSVPRLLQDCTPPGMSQMMGWHFALSLAMGRRT